MSDRRIIEIEAVQADDGITADELLRRHGISRRLITLLKRTEKGITRNNILCRSIDRISAGDIVVLRIPETVGGAVPNRSLSVPKIYEDEDIIVYDKPWGMPVHQSHGHQNDTLANAFAAEFEGIPFRAVNRLDRDTSGLCIAAKNRSGANFSDKIIEKVYFAVCEGIIEEPVRIDAPIARERESIIKRVVREDGQRAVTNIIPLRSGRGHTLLEVHLETGRTHQIRVHMAYIGHPLAGDDMYGGSRRYISRQALHCGKMKFTHPVTGNIVNLCSELPVDIAQVLQSEE